MANVERTGIRAGDVWEDRDGYLMTILAEDPNDPDQWVVIWMYDGKSVSDIVHEKTFRDAILRERDGQKVPGPGEWCTKQQAELMGYTEAEWAGAVENSPIGRVKIYGDRDNCKAIVRLDANQELPEAKLPEAKPPEKAEEEGNKPKLVQRRIVRWNAWCPVTVDGDGMTETFGVEWVHAYIIHAPIKNSKPIIDTHPAAFWNHEIKTWVVMPDISGILSGRVVRVLASEVIVEK